MNQEQKFTVSQAEGQVRQIRRTLEELAGFDWKATETTKPLQTFDAYKGRLALNQATADTLSPLEKDGKGKLVELLSEENLLVESLAKLAGEARAALTREELSFFAARDGLFATLEEQTEEADGQIRNGLNWLIDGLQTRWGLMQKSQELAQRFHSISEAHSTPESFGVNTMRLPKPFVKLHNASWHALIASFLARLGQVLPNLEKTEPADAVRTIYER
jgi:hypothetical protein